MPAFEVDRECASAEAWRQEHHELLAKNRLMGGGGGGGGRKEEGEGRKEVRGSEREGGSFDGDRREGGRGREGGWMGRERNVQPG